MESNPVVNPIQPAETNKGNQGTNAEVILYALVVYSYYFASKQTSKDIMDDSSPTAHGLFKHINLNYRVNFNTIDPNKNSDKDNNNAMRDVDLIKSKPYLKDYAMALNAVEEIDDSEKNIEGAEGSSDIAEQVPDED